MRYISANAFFTHDYTVSTPSVFWSIILYITCLSQLCLATSYSYNPKQRLVGKVSFIYLQQQYAQIDHLARSYDVGFDALLAANPILLSSHTSKFGTIAYIPSQALVPHIQPNQVVVNIPEKRMYFYHEASHKLYVWPVGIGREFHPTPEGVFEILKKRYKPIWYIPENALAELADKGILDHPNILLHNPINPLGEYAMNLSKPSYLIHGTHDASHIGTRSTSGCVNLYPEDIAEAYRLFKVGTRVKIINNPIKTYRLGNILYIEAHSPVIDGPVEDLLSIQKQALLNSLDNKTRSIVSKPEFLDKLTDDLQNPTGIPFSVNLYASNPSESKNPHT
ncbi:MAG: L,D-transpeptidase family protein [Pseudomonadota bacterium]|nr:L,D-transpeptidase family protein [Pseudomonadota bacterium]